MIDLSVFLPRKSMPRQKSVSREPGGRSLTTIFEPTRPPALVPRASPASGRGSTFHIR